MLKPIIVIEIEEQLIIEFNKTTCLKENVDVID